MAGFTKADRTTALAVVIACCAKAGAINNVALQHACTLVMKALMEELQGQSGVGGGIPDPAAPGRGGYAHPHP